MTLTDANQTHERRVALVGAPQWVLDKVWEWEQRMERGLCGACGQPTDYPLPNGGCYACAPRARRRYWDL